MWPRSRTAGAERPFGPNAHTYYCIGGGLVVWCRRVVLLQSCLLCTAGRIWRPRLHRRDETSVCPCFDRLFRSDFACCSVCRSHRRQGILPSELVEGHSCRGRAAHNMNTVLVYSWVGLLSLWDVLVPRAVFCGTGCGQLQPRGSVRDAQLIFSLTPLLQQTGTLPRGSCLGFCLPGCLAGFRCQPNL